MLTLHRTNSNNPDFQNLVTDLDIYLAIQDGAEHSFYAQFNKIDTIKHVVVVYENNMPVGCGAIKKYMNTTMEIKRMFVVPEKRNQGIASTILKELETWAGELNFQKCILETGKKQTEAIKLYLRNNYTIIANYGQYAAVENSVCFKKEL
jgi:GNAT superfamily N-acetyltransferase